MTDYNPILTDLGVDLVQHDALIASNDRHIEKTRLWQKNRPEGMAYFDHALHASHGERVAEIVEYRKAGGKSIGTFCIYVPDEIALAAEVLPIPLCGGSGWSVDYADKMFPRDICPLVRSTFGMAFSNTCPYKKLKDFALGETTCDAKKKTWDLLGFKVLELPQKKQAIDADLWRAEVREFLRMVEELSGVEVTAVRLRETIRLVNRKRRAMQRIDDLRKLPEPPISGIDALEVAQVALSQDIQRFITGTEALAHELQARAKQHVSAYEKPGMRVLVAGSPSPMPNAKVHYIVESAGMRVVADESCTGLRYSRDLVDETPNDLEGMLDAVAARYFKIDCSCFSPNQERVDNVKAIIEAYDIQGVVHNVLQYCHTYDIEAKKIDNALAEMGIPSIKVVTDYSEEDTEQIRVRLETFKEVAAQQAQA
ncbi:double-cubane-cluster-containing anaerobic reductase [Myxococcota bacterium]